MNGSSQQNINIKALAWTVVVHGLLLLLFIFLHYSLPAAEVPPPEMGMEVNLGTSDNGSGADQPMKTEDPAPAATVVSNKSAAQASTTANDILQSNDKDAPAIVPPGIKNDLSRNNVTENNKRNRADQQQTNDNNNHKRDVPKYVYNGGTGKGGNGGGPDIPGSSEGNTTGKGDRGMPGGIPGATNYAGSPGSGNGGISHTLSGRKITPDRFEASFHEGGTVIIRVTVDRNGSIVSKSIKSSPSAELSKIALQKLSQAKFSASPDAQPQQFGQVTIVFKTRS